MSSIKQTKDNKQTFTERCHSPESKRYYVDLPDGSFIGYTATEEKDPKPFINLWEKISPHIELNRRKH